jgi:polyisoprenoid-binding protein YceI
MSQSVGLREVEGVVTPPAGTWVVDPQHSSVEAVARHLMVSKVRGRFGEYSGVIHIGEDPQESWAEAVISAASIDTNAPDRDAHLRSPDFMDVESFPELKFRSTSLRSDGDHKWKAEGDLTIRGVTKPITLEVELLGINTDPFGNTRAQFSATGRLDREAYGMTWNAALESGGVLLGRYLDIEIEISAVLQ